MKNILQIILVLILVSNFLVVKAATDNLANNSSSKATTVQEIVDLKEYITKLMDKAYQIFNNTSMSQSDKTKKIKKLIDTHLYLDWMSKYSLGLHRRVVSKEKMDEFCKIYSKYIVRIYTDLSETYKGEKTVLKKIHKIDDRMFIANMEILKSNNQSIKIDYLIYKIPIKNGHEYRVGDIITENISILNSQKAEFNNVISSYGNTNGGIEKLITNLYKIINSTKR